MGEEKTSVNAFWKFGDSPFTWGGIGVLVGSAIASPTWFRFAFISGGISIAIGLWRAGFGTISKVFLFFFLAGGWILLWRVIPKPVEPLTKKDAQEIFSRAQDADHSQHGEPAESVKNLERPITKAEFLNMLHQYQSSAGTFANITKERLNEITKSAVSGLAELGDTWQADDADTDRGVSELIRFAKFPDGHGDSRPMNEVEIAKVRRDASQRKATNHAKLIIVGKDLIAKSCDLRIEIVHNRLTWNSYYRQTDSKQDALFTRLKTSNYDRKDVSQAHEYLSALQKELEAQPRL
jgi:hypothetical protein